MADYKRMVSYMYQYENGVKRKNVGYARVEAKNGQCKITLHMQLLGQLDSIFPTYLIQRDENNLELIYLGDTVLKNQIMDSKLSADENNIMESGYGLSDMGGLLIFLNDYVFFATEWDDKPIVAKEVLEAMKPKPKKSKVPEVAEESGPELKQEEAQDDVLETVQVASSIVTEEKKESPKEDETLIPNYKLPRGWKTIERLQKPYMAAPNHNSNAVEVADYKEVKDYPVSNVESEKIDYLKGKDDRESLNETETMAYAETMAYTEGKDDSEGMNDTEGKDDTEVIDYADVIDNDSVEKTNLHNVNEAVELPDPPTALYFFENYPRIYPFEDNEISLCVKIEPKDIGLLPKELWALSNNSFLMHGYYCYHHLIFAKMKDKFGCHYVLGIPGIFHNREKFMARMFGFESFKSIRKRELRQGDFGYWYLPISL